MEIPQPMPPEQTDWTFLEKPHTKTTAETQEGQEETQETKEESRGELKAGESRIIQARARYDITEAHEGTGGIIVFESVGLIPYPTDSTLLTAGIITFLLLIMR